MAYYFFNFVGGLLLLGVVLCIVPFVINMAEAARSERVDIHFAIIPGKGYSRSCSLAGKRFMGVPFITSTSGEMMAKGSPPADMVTPQ